MEKEVVESQLVHTAFSKGTRLTSFFQEYNNAAFIVENICKKQCIYYVENLQVATTQGTEICKCGHTKSIHCAEAFNYVGPHSDDWHPKTHTRKVPTDAFGTMNFTNLGKNSAKYVRVSVDTPPEKLFELLTSCWQLDVPNLLISVTGGAKNIVMKPQLRNMFRRGLIKVAQSTGAWIITGGSHAGVMKHVGEAMRDSALSSTSKDGKIVAIGIGTWGIVYNQESLIRRPGSSLPAEYAINEGKQGRLSFLDYNHSHFILVDDGTHGIYGVEIMLRAKLEKFIAKQTIGKSVGINIPAVCLVLGGGPGTLDTIYNAMQNDTPCVILEGSGHVADVIAEVATLPLSRITVEQVQKHLKTFFAKDFDCFSEDEIIEWTKKIQDIMRMPQLLTVFRMDKKVNKELDMAILQAVLKASKSVDYHGQDNWEHQLKLAVAWNRMDIAKCKIFKDDWLLKSTGLRPVMMVEALIADKSNFVRLFLENGMNLQEILTKSVVLELYNNLSSSSLIYRMLIKEVEGPELAHGQWRIQMHHVSNVLQELLGDFTQPLYHLQRSSSKFAVFIHVSLSGELELSFSCLFAARNGKEVFEDPIRDLFIWAILQCRTELAQIVWEQCQDCLAAALAASKILKELAKKEEDTDGSEEIQNLAEEYEKHAIGVFNECHRRDEERAQKLLIRISKSWGHTTCLRLALEADNQNFVAQGGVQALLTKIWWGQLAEDTHLWKVLLCMLFFPLIYTGLITFREKKIGTHDINTPSGAVRHFYSAPVIVFYWNVVSFFGFLWLYAYVLMMNFQKQPVWQEILLYVWVCTLFCEELRQLFHGRDKFGFLRKAEIYFSKIWNVFDVLSFCFFAAGVACRLTPTTLYFGRIILSIGFIVYCLRLVDIFTVNKNLGPKIIIVKRMLKDIFFFLFLLGVWVVAYGVARQAILIENETRLEWIFRGVVYQPYLTIFGQMPSSMDSVNYDRSQCTMNGTNPTKPKCPILDSNGKPAFPTWLTIILVCIYLLFANILLLNLLIAMFNFTFQMVQDNNDQIWKFQRFGLIKEYHCHPTFPPPFIILVHIYLFFKRVTKRKEDKRYKQFKQELPNSEEMALLSWESFMKEIYLMRLQQKLSNSNEQKIQDLADRVGILVKLVEGDNGRQVIEKRLAHLEEQVSMSTEALGWIVNALAAKGFGSCQGELACCGKRKEVEQKETLDKKVVPERHHHVNARQLLYPGSSVKRFPVPDERVPWEVDFSAYKPLVYNAQTGPATEEPNGQNPMGRTGLSGRGKLHHLGPNYSMDLILTCWKRNSDGSVCVKAAKKVLRFFSVKRKECQQWAFPGGPLQPGEVLPARLKGILGSFLQKKITKMLSHGREVRCSRSFLTFPSSHPTPLSQVYKGYVDDTRNTDEAWIETTAINLHFEEDDEVLAELKKLVSVWPEVPPSDHPAVVCLDDITDPKAEITAAWQDADQLAKLTANHRELLQKVAVMWQAHC
ncbi:transient receptor potential cation channel subfamily M member 2-like [Erpetoichthys calabaricus]|uniref:transient receptor potential cation channel subfamily M member 2-like n=1 Tax=Erpetoichthys calabaricus TaxID=27687 RepID=UPI0022349822|nr:transient receptor potential cation channel subfamily M member 2-like [Erpetoichthys calabaricus]